jgi:uncharacterized lipoprotein YajG
MKIKMNPAIAAMALAAGLLSGCAATRSTIDLPVSRPEAARPATQKAVKLVRVSDKRMFELNPSEPSKPSLGNPEEIKDPAITARAIARKRGGFGMALADILLPPGRTVEQVVAEAVASALRDQGYTVVDEKSPAYGSAVPVTVDIQQFWSWLTPGFWAISIEFESIVVIRSTGLFPNPEETIRGYTLVRTIAATDGEWQKTMQQGLADLVEQIKKKLVKA